MCKTECRSAIFPFGTWRPQQLLGVHAISCRIRTYIYICIYESICVQMYAALCHLNIHIIIRIYRYRHRLFKYIRICRHTPALQVCAQRRNNFTQMNESCDAFCARFCKYQSCNVPAKALIVERNSFPICYHVRLEHACIFCKHRVVVYNCAMILGRVGRLGRKPPGIKVGGQMSI